MGGLSVSGAFVTGTGAFTSVSADRDVAVAVADDANAFLRLAPCPGSDNGAYVDNSDGLLTIDLSGSNTNNPPAGDGVNPEALSVFDNVFEIANQGTQDVCVDFEVDVPQIPDGADVPDRYDFGPGDPAVVFYRGDSRDEFVINNVLNPDRDGAIKLPIDNGSAECIGFEVRAFGFDSTTDLFDGVDLTIRADANATCQVDGTDAVDPVPTGPTDGLVSYWPLDSIGDDTADDVVGSNDGTAKPDLNGPTSVSGQVDDAALFDGDVDYVNVPHDSVFDLDTFTISLWFKTNDNLEDEIGVLINKQDRNDQHADRNWWLVIDNGQGFAGSNGHLGLRTSSGGSVDVDLTARDQSYDDEKWYHAVGVVDASNDDARLYATAESQTNVQEKGSASSVDMPEGQGNPIQIGKEIGRDRSSSNPRYFGGKIDDVRIYDRALTGEEVQDLFDATK